MKKQKENSTSKTIDVEYTEQDIQDMREQGVPEDELPCVGVHKFGRSKFITKRSDQKIKVSIFLDADILDFFKELAAKPNAAPFQTQINNELRALMELQSCLETKIRIYHRCTLIKADKNKIKPKELR